MGMSLPEDHSTQSPRELVDMSDYTTESSALANNLTFKPEQSCREPWQTQEQIVSTLIIPSILLVIINILVIGGNLLVIISVFTCRKLRTITNTYVVSLAFADLLLGVLVLPFSGTQEVLPYWPYGSVWCYMWLAIDVFLCTASILSLCVISFDRYLAISRPFKYQTLMSPLKAKLLVGAVWIVAFVVCCPPLIGWNERGHPLTDEPSIPTTQSPDLIHSSSNYTNSSFQYVYYTVDMYTISLEINQTDNGDMTSENEVCEPCELNLKRGYVIYSALGSFWIPVWIMAFFYWKIYTIAARTTRGVRRGVLRARSNDSSASSNQVTLRIHRGGSCQRHSTSSFRSESQTESLITPSPSFTSRKNSDTSLRCSIRQISSGDNSTVYKQIRSNSTCGTTGHTTNGISLKKASKVTFSDSDNNNYHIETKPLSSIHRNSALPNGLAVHSIIEEEDEDEETSFTNSEQNRSSPHQTRTLTRMGTRFNIRNKIKSFNREKKAAKTVGIIVGCFILCWAPFFTVYLLTAFCTGCTPSILFKIFFWLGYCNSAINPFVYALFSKDFRFAFKQLLCCRCARRKHTYRDRRNSRFRSFFNSLRIQISSRSSDENTIME